MLTFLLACSGAPEDSAAALPDPMDYAVDEAGPFNVGVQIFDWTYRPTGADEDRTIAITLWYPTLDERGSAAEYYGAFQDPGTILDAEWVGSVHDGGVPVHVYSHGSYGYGGASPFMSKHFASHGWVVVAPDHTGNTIGDFNDELPISIRWWRAEDVSQALDQADAALGLNTSQALMSGHSFGGYTSWVTPGATFDQDYIAEVCGDDACTENDFERFAEGVDDPRVAATIPMAGGGGSWVGDYTGIAEPVLMMSGSEDGPQTQQDIFDTSGLTELIWLDIEGGCHQVFALGQCEGIETQRGFDIINVYALAFGRRHILDDPTVQAILDGSQAVDEAATLQVR
jgi:predicted dienelactone hydrolase